MEALGGEENRCPKCEQPMTLGPWKSQQSRRYVAMAACPEHGNFLLRVRLAPEEDGTVKAIRLIYEGDSEVAKNLETIVAAKPKVRKRSRRKKS